jgi:hypothetical protein
MPNTPPASYPQRVYSPLYPNNAYGVRGAYGARVQYPPTFYPRQRFTQADECDSSSAMQPDSSSSHSYVVL